MSRRLGISLVISVVLAVPVFAALPAAGQSTPTASTKDACKDGGWRNLTDNQGQPFRNEGQCVSFRIHHPVSLADLAGSFTGSNTFFDFGPFPGCFALHSFHAAYPGSAAVGTVTFDITRDCLNFGGPGFLDTGTFTLSTNVGTVSGTLSGTLRNNPFVGITDFDLTLTVTLGTGAFAGTTGTLHARFSARTGIGSIATT